MAGKVKFYKIFKYISSFLENEKKINSNNTPKNFNTNTNNVSLGLNNYNSKWSIYKSNNSYNIESAGVNQPGMNKNPSIRNFVAEVNI